MYSQAYKTHTIMHMDNYKKNIFRVFQRDRMTTSMYSVHQDRENSSGNISSSTIAQAQTLCETIFDLIGLLPCSTVFLYNRR